MTDEGPLSRTITHEGRSESPEERADRNWNELLQELRVMQTGVQILTGFLLTLPFQPRFAELDDFQRTVYLGLVITAVVATALIVGPVAIHRSLFRKHLKMSVVTAGDTVTRAALFTLALTVTGTALLVFDVVVGREAGLWVGGSVLLALLVLWVIVPEVLRRRR